MLHFTETSVLLYWLRLTRITQLSTERGRG